MPIIELHEYQNPPRALQNAITEYQNRHGAIAYPSRLALRDLTDLEIDQQRRETATQYENRVVSAKGNATLKKYLYKVNRVSCYITATSDDPFVARKIHALKTVLETLEKDHYFDLPNDDLDVFCHAKQFCLGYLLSNAGRLRAAIFLGGATHARPGILVANQIYDYYKPTLTVDPLEKQILTAIFHEFGHIYHQLHSPSHYHGISTLQFLYTKTPPELATNADYNLFYPDSPSAQKLALFMRGIQQWAGTVSQYATNNPMEFVAEVFSGLMMGVTYDQTVMDLYGSCGGPQPPVGTTHVRSGRSQLKRAIYPVSKRIFSMGEGY